MPAHEIKSRRGCQRLQCLHREVLHMARRFNSDPIIPVEFKIVAGDVWHSDHNHSAIAKSLRKAFKRGFRLIEML